MLFGPPGSRRASEGNRATEQAWTAIVTDGHVNKAAWPLSGTRTLPALTLLFLSSLIPTTVFFTDSNVPPAGILEARCGCYVY